MIVALTFFLGFSIATNIALSLFLLFVFKDQKLKEQVYETFDKNVEIVKENNDPFRSRL